MAELREAWLEDHPRIAEAWRDPLREDLQPFVGGGEVAQEAMRTAATALWCLGWADSPARRTAFLLIANGLAAMRGSAAAPAPQAGSGVTKREQRELKRNMRGQNAELSDVRNQAKEAASALRLSEDARKSEVRARARVERELAEARAAVETAERERAGAIAVANRRGEQLKAAQGGSQREKERAEALEATVATLSDKLDAVMEAQERLVAALSQTQKAHDDLASQLERRDVLAHTFIEERLAHVEEQLEIVQGGRVDELRAERKTLRALRIAFLEAFPQFLPERPTPRAPQRAPVRYRGLGGADEVGASSYLLEIAGKRLLVDCGIRVGARHLDMLGPAIDDLPKLDAVIATHAHVDHVGWLPKLRRVMEDDLPSIYVTPETSQLLPVMLDDSLQQLRRMVAERSLLARHMVNTDEVEQPYEARDKDSVLFHLLSSDYGENNALRGDVRFRFFRAGHVLGAGSVWIETPDSRIFVTGDFSDFDQRTVEGARWPDEISAPDLMLMEATYGAKDHPPREELIARFIRDLRRVTSAGGVALVACFALGRAQEILSIIDDALDTGELRNTQVYIDGMIEKINPIYERFGKLSLSAAFSGVRGNEWQREELIARLRKESGIVVTTAGMLQGGPVVMYAKQLLADGRNQLFLTGYQEEGTLGRRIAEQATRPGATIEVTNEEGKKEKIKLATPASVVGLSAHAGRKALLAAVERVRPKHLVLVHGEEAARSSLRPQMARFGVTVLDSVRAEI